MMDAALAGPRSSSASAPASWSPIAGLIAGSVARRRLVALILVVLVGVGVGVARHLRLDALPDITTNQVLVLTRAPGLTPEEVERLVTRPIESALGGLPGLTEQRSLSRYGISSITTVFEDDVAPYLARQVVQERLNGVAGALPAGVEAPELGPLSGGLGEIYHFTLTSAQRSPAALLELATFKVAPLLRAVPGVVEVNTWGGERRTLDVYADPVRVAQRGHTLDSLRQGLEGATGSVAGASVPAGSQQALLRGVAWPRSPGELGAAILPPVGVVAAGEGDRHEAEGGAFLRVGDVAEVRPGTAPRIGAATSNGRGETVYLMAQMLRGENALEVLRGVRERMSEVRKVLPPDVRVDVVYDRGALVQATLRTVGKNLLEGGGLVIAVLLLMLGSWRAGLIVAAVIPLSMLGALAGMVALGVPGNLMSLGAIDFGLIVDGAVVMVENLFHEVEHGGGRDEGAAARVPAVQVAEAGRLVARPVFFSVLILLMVYAPILALEGVEGKLFRPMAVTVVLALVSSLLLALTVVPALSALVLRRQDVPRRPPLLARWMERAYRPQLRLSVAHPRVVALVGVLLLGLGGFLAARAGSEFVPQLDEGDLVVQTTRAADISLPAAVREAGRLEATLLRRVPEVLQVVSRVGSPAVATDIMGIEQADVFVALRPRAAWRPGLTREALIRDIGRALDEDAPGGSPSFTQPIEMRFNELLAGTVTDVAVAVYGDDLAELRRLCEAIAKAVARVPGAADVRVLAPPAVSLVEVRPRPLDAAQAGFTVREVLDAVQAVRTGVPVGMTYDGPVRVPILLRTTGTATAFTLRDLPLASRSGGTVPLSRVADVDLISAPSLINHHNSERRLLVGFNVRGADLGRVVAAAQGSVEALPRPPGYRIHWGGQFQNLQDASRRLLIIIPLVLVLILGLLVMTFGRLRPALVIFTHVPFACVGGVVALAARGMPLSISAAIGFIALSGVAVLNGVVLMARILQNEAAGLAAAEAGVRAAESRARPVLMTALVAALGFVPMMLATGVGAEVQRPLATVVVGGLVTSTALTLLILPSLYPAFARLGRFRQAAGKESAKVVPPSGGQDTDSAPP